jgi:hypothetical protein
LKPRYIFAALAIFFAGLLISSQAPLLSKLLLTKTVVFEIPRRDFRLHVERVWRGDVVRLDFEVGGGDENIYVYVERTHFYIAPRVEYGAPARVLTATVHDSSLISGSDSIPLTIDLEGHLNIFINNTISSMPKTVTFTRVFERSTNMIYATLIIRNLLSLASITFVLLGIAENYLGIRAWIGARKHRSKTG